MKEKSNRVYKLAAVLMILCLITACVIGTTLAKYTTSGSGSDTAQVAKWGVKVVIQNAGGVFDKEYKNGDTTTVLSSTTNDVVAPGTSKPNALTFSISGTPEVSAKVEFEFTVTNDVFVKYSEVTTGASGEYHPIKFTLTKTGETTPLVNGGTLADVKSKIESLCTTSTGETSTPTVYAPGTDLAEAIGTYQLSWTWDYDDATGSGSNDVYDTFFGDKIAEEGAQATENYSTKLSYTFTITVTQVD